MLSKPRASSGFIYRAGSCQAHRPQGWSVNGKEDFTPTPGFSKNHQTTVTKSLGFSPCELPAAVLFKELTWHWYNVRTLTMRSTFDLGNKFWSVGWVRGYWEGGKMKSPAVAPGDWAGAEEWVSNSAVSGITPRCRTCPKRRQNEVVRQTRGCRVSARAQAPLSFCLRGDDLVINSPAKVGRVGGKRSFWLLYAWQPCFYKMGCWKQNRAINNSSDMHICMDEDEV